MKARRIINTVVEGAGEPGYDLPVVYRVTFTWGGRRWTKEVECTSASQKKWATTRAITSVLKQNGIPRDQFPLNIHFVLDQGNVNVTDVSMATDTRPIPFRARKR